MSARDGLVSKLRSIELELRVASWSSPLGPLHAAGLNDGSRDAANRIAELIESINADSPAGPSNQTIDGVSAILDAFPLFDGEGLSETEHCCEWTLLQERRRLHEILGKRTQDGG